MARILLVDDEPSIRFLTRKILEKVGHEVVEVRDGEEGLRFLEKDRADLVLLDVMMPGMNGWEVCEKIKSDEGLKAIPVVMFTVRVSHDSMIRSQESGAEAHINKPFDRKELLETVERVLEKVPPDDGRPVG
jgi:CheY-like chemotaxis protein